VAGIGAPGLALWKGDRVAACIAAASVIAKVTRDRLMVAMHDEFPAYGFDEHKGYVTPDHQQALRRHGPCGQHRRSFVNVRVAGGMIELTRLAGAEMSDNAGVTDDPPGAELPAELIELPVEV
jgi:ribonuclease HII